MQRLLTLAAHRPWLVFVVLITITLAAASQLPSLRIEITAEGMMVNLPNSLADYEHSLQTFGSDSITVIYLEDEDLLRSDKLKAIQRALHRIEAIPQVTHTTSLFSLRYLRTEDGFTYTSPYFSPVPGSQSAIRQHADAALLNPLIERNLLSRDGKAMAINVYLDVTDYYRGFDEELSSALDQAIAPLRGDLRRVFQLGDPRIRADISEQIRSDLKLTLPLALVVLSLSLWFIFRRSCTALIPLLTAGMSVIWTFGLMATLDMPVNVMTSIIPALLVVIGSTEDIHLIAEYQSGIQRGFTSSGSTHLMAKHMGTAILLTFVTTSLGFISIVFNRIDLLQQFGLTMAIGLMLNFVITSTLVPACLRCLPNRSPHPEQSGERRFAGFTERLSIWLSRHSRQFLFALALLLGVCAYGACRVEINNSILSYLPSSSLLPQQAGLVESKLSGIQSLTLLIRGEQGAFLKSANLLQLQKLQRHLAYIKGFDKSFSFADFVAVVHSGLEGERPHSVHLPENDAVVSGYMSLLGHDSARSFVSADYSEARIIVRHAIDSSKQLNQAVENFIRYARASLPPSLEVRVTGSSYLNSQAVDYMAEGQARSLIMLLVIIFLLITLLLSNAKLGLIAVISNLLPIVVLFGVMGYFRITLDTSTVMVAAIALGISVDHSMHFMVRYQAALRQGISWRMALRHTLRQESQPILSTTLALTLGFATLAFSTFPPVAQFGLLSAMVMLLALISTFVATPLMLGLMNGLRHSPGKLVKLSDLTGY